MQKESVIEKFNLDKTTEVFEFIKEKYSLLKCDELLAIEYTGTTQDYRFYHMMDWYYSSSLKRVYQTTYRQDYFNHKKLIDLLNENNIEYYDYHIDSEEVKKQLDNAVFTSFRRPDYIRVASNLFVGENPKQKAKTRDLIVKF